MSDCHPNRRRARVSLTLDKCLFLTLMALTLTVRAEIKFIHRSDNVLEDAALLTAHRNKVDRPHEPLALESTLVARVDLTPSNGSDGVPNINSSPVLQFVSPEEEESEEEDYEDDDDKDAEEGENVAKEDMDQGLSAAVGQLLKSKEEDPLKISDKVVAEVATNDGEESDDQNLTRHRRRLMLLRSRNILVPETSTSMTTSVSTSTVSSSSSPRPPKEHIIYALPEQGFWARPEKKGTGGRKGKGSSKQGKVPNTPHLDEDAAPGTTTTETTSTTTSSTEVPIADESVDVDTNLAADLNDQRQNYANSPSYYPTSSESSNFYNQPANYPSSSPAPPPQAFYLTTPPPTTPTTSTTTLPPETPPTSPTPSPAETLRMTLAEKKFHLGQCMRYCMDAIL